MSKNILLVEDETFLAKVIKKVIEHSGHQVAIASNGVEALEYLQTQNTPDLILCDMTMPVMDGNEFYGIVSRIPSYSNIPLVMMSGGGQTAFADGKSPNYFLPKPFSMDDLKLMVQAF
jgi:CheY-like chemotaxis protein